MDNIQKALIKAGRRDLAQKYYNKIAGKIRGIPDGTGPYGRGMGPGKGQTICRSDEEDYDEETKKESGKIKGPGIPDGTGPMKDDSECPYNEKSKKEAETNNRTFKCPECGSKVLDNTSYCVKCKKKAEKTAAAKTAKRFKNKAEFIKASADFLKAISSKFVKAKTERRVEFQEKGGFQFYTLTFEIYLDLKADPYINHSMYEKGEAYFYLSNKYYVDVNKAAKKFFDVEPDWNNTRKTGWISGYVKEI